MLAPLRWVLALGIVAMQTDTIVLPIIGAVVRYGDGSVGINRLSRKLRGGKGVFVIACTSSSF